MQYNSLIHVFGIYTYKYMVHQWGKSTIFMMYYSSYIFSFNKAIICYYFLGSDEISLSADSKYPALGEDFQLTCTIDTDIAGWQVTLHRHTGVGNGADCGQCSPPLYEGVIGRCMDTTTATYGVQCTVEGTAITMVLDVTGVTNVEIGQWTCNTAIGVQPEADIIITELGTIQSTIVIYICKYNYN